MMVSFQDCDRQGDLNLSSLVKHLLISHFSSPLASYYSEINYAVRKKTNKKTLESSADPSLTPTV